MLSFVKRIIISCIFMAHCSLYTASIERGEYKIAPTQVASFLAAATHHPHLLKTAYAHNATVSLLVQCKGEPTPKKNDFDSFAEGLMQKTMQNIACERLPLQREDVLSTVDSFLGMRWTRSCNVSYLLLGINANELLIYAHENVFCPKSSALTKYHQLSDDNLQITFSAAGPSLQIVQHAQADFNPVEDAKKRIDEQSNKDAICLSFNPTRWRKETDFRPFIKPISSYPILCDESKHGFKSGVIVALSLMGLLEGFEPCSTYADKQQFMNHRAGPLIGLMILLGAFPQTAVAESRRAYRLFFNNEKRITSKWYIDRDAPLSQSIFNAAATCRSSKAQREWFHDLYQKLVKKVIKDKPYDEQEKNCDAILSDWRDRSGATSVYIPVHETCRLHNRFYEEAIAGIKLVRAAEGFAAGACLTVLLTALLQVFLLQAFAQS